MKKHILSLSIFAFAVLLTFTACQKESTPPSSNDETVAKTHSDDDSRFSSEMDAIASDANLMLESQSGFSGKGTSVQSLICDATIAVDTASNPRTITITYNGTNCLGTRTRTGVVILSMPQNVRWKDAGAAITITCQNLKITRISDNKSITINGSQTFTNQSGGLLIQLPVLGTITHLVNSDGITVTFDNGAQRVWKVARKHDFTYNNGVIINISGNHSENGVNNIAEWGTNRFGNPFVSTIVNPIVLKQDCLFRISEGKVQHQTQNVTIAATFGLDANGNPTACPGVGLYYLKLEWTGPSGGTHSVILPY